MISCLHENELQIELVEDGSHTLWLQSDRAWTVAYEAGLLLNPDDRFIDFLTEIEVRRVIWLLKDVDTHIRMAICLSVPVRLTTRQEAESNAIWLNRQDVSRKLGLCDQEPEVKFSPDKSLEPDIVPTPSLLARAESELPSQIRYDPDDWQTDLVLFLDPDRSLIDPMRLQAMMLVSDVSKEVDEVIH